MPRPDYEALDKQGLPFIRPARIVGELPTPEARHAALVEATIAIAERAGIRATADIKLSTPVFCALDGMRRTKAKHHEDSALLLTLGEDVPLEFCASYR